MKTPRVTNCLLFIWLCCYTGLSYAAGSLYDDAKSYDWGSLWVAACAGMLGGFLQTILTLSSDKRIVLDIIKDAGKDLVVALIGGLAVYLCIQAASGFVTIPRDVRILLIVGAGFSRGRWQWVIAKFAGDAVNRGRGLVRGEPPTSAAAPLGKE
jgi:hypothetical protein